MHELTIPRSKLVPHVLLAEGITPEVDATGSVRHAGDFPASLAPLFKRDQRFPGLDGRDIYRVSKEAQLLVTSPFDYGHEALALANLRDIFGWNVTIQEDA